MNINARYIGAAITLMLLLGAIAGMIIEYFLAAPLLAIALSFVQIGVQVLMAIAYWYGWRYAPYATAMIVTILVFLANVTTVTPDLVDLVVLLMLLPPAITMVLLEPVWVFGVAAATLTSHLIYFTLIGSALPSSNLLLCLLLYVLLVGSMILGRLGTASAVRYAEANARRAEEARERIAVQSEALTKINQEQENYITEQRKLMELVAALETPAVTLADGVLLAPIVGHLDSRRTQQLAEQLMEQVYARRAKLVILDISGVNVIDTAVAKALIDTSRSVQLLGCRVILSGISADVAATLTTQRVALGGIATVRSPQEALEQLTYAAPLV